MLPGRPTVLVVDDVPETRELLRFLLQDEGITVVGEAGNGKQAVDLAHHLRPDVVLMDMMMPDMDGVAATQAIMDSLPATYLVGGLACWFNSKCQRLGDLAANTIVVHTPRVAQPDLDQLLAGKFKRERRRVLGWTLFLSGLASTIPIAMHVFGKKDASASAH